MPNCADEIVAPVVGETNLFMQSCCIISPAMLIPTPVHRIAKSLGRREIKKISHCSISPDKSPLKLMSKTPTKRDHMERTSKLNARHIVKPYLLMISPPFVFGVRNFYVKLVFSNSSPIKKRCGKHLGFRSAASLTVLEFYHKAQTKAIYLIDLFLSTNLTGS